jgi:hypothetical protein
VTEPEQDCTAESRDQDPRPLPVTPSDKTERPDGLAFDVEKGTDLPGVPTGDQRPSHQGAAHTEQVVTEKGHGVGLELPGDTEESGAAVSDDGR